MVKFLIRRLLGLVVVLLGLTVVMFVIVRLIPGDPVRAVLGYDATREMVEAFRATYGLDRPVLVQYGAFLGGLLRGDLGVSTMSGQPVAFDLRAYLPATVELALASVVISVLIGFPLGVLAALQRGRFLDTFASTVALVFIAIPVFWFGLLLQLVFYRLLSWLPYGGRIGDLPAGFSQVTGLLTIDALINLDFGLFWQAVQHLLLPAFSLSALLIASIARTTRMALSQVLSEQYVRTARSKGLSEAIVVLKHALRNAFLPILTVMGLRIGELLGGAVITETIFQWPGIGLYAVRAISYLDTAAIMGFSLVAISAYALINLVVDVLYSVLDPRIGVNA